MFSFKDSIMQNINNEIVKYISCISKKYKIPQDELLSIWNNKEEEKVDEKVVEEVVEKKVKKKVKNEVKQNKGCIYVFKRGKNKGKMCGLRCVKGSKYCSKHKKYEYKEHKIKKEIVPEPVKKQTIIRMNKKINKFWHPETRLVFKSKEERIVIGKCTEDNLIQALTEEDIKICQARSFAFKQQSEEKKIKNKVQKAILDVNIQAQDIENILNELQINGNDTDSEDELLDEED